MLGSRLPLSADKDCPVFIKIFLTNAGHYLRYTSVPFIGLYLSEDASQSLVLTAGYQNPIYKRVLIM